MAGSRTIAGTDWMWSDESPEITQIAAAAGCATFDELKALHQTLKTTNELLGSIRTLLLGLGGDGIHEVIRHHRGVARRAATRERTKRRLAREARRGNGTD